MNRGGRYALEGRALRRVHPSWREHIVSLYGAQAWATAAQRPQRPAHQFLRATLSSQLGLGEPVPEGALDCLGACALGWSVRRTDRQQLRVVMETLPPEQLDAFSIGRQGGMELPPEAMRCASALLAGRVQGEGSIRLGGLILASLAEGASAFPWDLRATASCQPRSMVLECRALVGALCLESALCEQAALWIHWAVAYVQR